MALHSHCTAFAHGQVVVFTHQATGYPTPTNSLTQCTDSDPQGKMLSTPSDLFTHSHTCLDNGRQAGLYAEVFPRSTEIPSFRVQHVQALLSLCSKSCFTFPSWTCSLLALDQCSPLDELYHPLHTPTPGGITHGQNTTYGKEPHMINRILTLLNTHAPKACICTSIGCTS